MNRLLVRKPAGSNFAFRLFASEAKKAPSKSDVAAKPNFLPQFANHSRPWLKEDPYLFKHLVFPPHHIAPHPRAMVETFGFAPAIRNLPWRFYWEHMPYFRTVLYTFPLVSWIWWKCVQPVRQPDMVKKSEEQSHRDHLKMKALYHSKQREADLKHFGWTKGDLDPLHSEKYLDTFVPHH